MSGRPLSQLQSMLNIEHDGATVIQNLQFSETELRRFEDDGDLSRHRSRQAAGT
jgi:hypothetical protein